MLLFHYRISLDHTARTPAVIRLILFAHTYISPWPGWILRDLVASSTWLACSFLPAVGPHHLPFAFYFTLPHCCSWVQLPTCSYLRAFPAAYLLRFAWFDFYHHHCLFYWFIPTDFIRFNDSTFPLWPILTYTHDHTALPWPYLHSLLETDCVFDLSDDSLTFRVVLLFQWLAHCCVLIDCWLYVHGRYSSSVREYCWNILSGYLWPLFYTFIPLPLTHSETDCSWGVTSWWLDRCWCPTHFTPDIYDLLRFLNIVDCWWLLGLFIVVLIWWFDCCVVTDLELLLLLICYSLLLFPGVTHFIHSTFYGLLPSLLHLPFGVVVFLFYILGYTRGPTFSTTLLQDYTIHITTVYGFTTTYRDGFYTILHFPTVNHSPVYWHYLFTLTDIVLMPTHLLLDDLEELVSIYHIPILLIVTIPHFVGRRRRLFIGITVIIYDLFIFVILLLFSYTLLPTTHSSATTSIDCWSLFCCTDIPLLPPHSVVFQFTFSYWAVWPRFYTCLYTTHGHSYLLHVVPRCSIFWWADYLFTIPTFPHLLIHTVLFCWMLIVIHTRYHYTWFFYLFWLGLPTILVPRWLHILFWYTTPHTHIYRLYICSRLLPPQFVTTLLFWIHTFRYFYGSVIVTPPGPFVVLHTTARLPPHTLLPPTHHRFTHFHIPSPHVPLQTVLHIYTFCLFTTLLIWFYTIHR